MGIRYKPVKQLSQREIFYDLFKTKKSIEKSLYSGNRKTYDLQKLANRYQDLKNKADNRTWTNYCLTINIIKSHDVNSLLRIILHKDIMWYDVYVTFIIPYPCTMKIRRYKRKFKKPVRKPSPLGTWPLMPRPWHLTLRHTTVKSSGKENFYFFPKGVNKF